MVSTKIFTATDTKVKSESGYAANRSARAGDDFTRTLDSTMKSSGSNYSKSDNHVKTVVRSDKSQVSKESLNKKQLRKLFQQGNNDNTGADTDIPDSNAGLKALAQITVLSANIANELADRFDVTAEEVSQVMEQLSLDDFDMLDVKNVFEVITELSEHGDMTELITDDSMAALLKDIKQEVAEVVTAVEQLGITRETYDEAIKSGNFDTLKSDTELVDDAEKDMTVSTAYDIQTKKTDNANNADSTGDKKEETSENKSDDALSGDKASDVGAKENVHHSEALQGAVSTADVISNIEEFIGESDSVRESGLSESIFRQILDGISANAGPDTTSLELQLNPESLGKVHITVSSRAGVLTAQIAAQNQIAKEAIESQVNVLRESFESQGLKVEEVEITLAGRGFEQSFDREEQGAERNPSRRGRHISQSELDEINGISTNQDELADEIHREQGNTVSYTA